MNTVTRKRGAARKRIFPLVALHMGGIASVVCAVWAYVVEPEVPAAPRGVTVMEFVVPAEEIVPAIQHFEPKDDIIQSNPLET